MDLYGLDRSLFEFGFSDPSLVESISSSHPMIGDRRYLEREEENLLKISSSILKILKRYISPPKHRHDGTSPLPLGMDWSSAPRDWITEIRYPVIVDWKEFVVLNPDNKDGVNTIWPHDFHTGWSYCVTVPSWSILAESRGSEPVVYYRVQVGLQSPEGVSTTRGVLKRYSDFLKLSTDLKQSFRNKRLPPAPPKGLLRMTSRTLLEERRCHLEDWMAKVLSDIDVSRSAPVAYFLELEAAARSSFRELSHDVNLSSKSSSSSDPLSSQSDISVTSGTSTQASNYNNVTTTKTSEIQSDLYVKDTETDTADNRNPVLKNDPASPAEATINKALPETSSEAIDKFHVSDVQFSPETSMVLPLDEQQKMSRLLTNTQQQLVTSKADTEDLIARADQELAVRQYLTAKVKDLETELESSKQIDKENLEQALSNERERFTQLQWDMQELRREYMDMEFRLKAEQDEKAHSEKAKASIVKENEALQLELDSAREQLKYLQKCRVEADTKSKSDAKLLVREVKSLRSSQSELKLELDRVSKESLEFKTRLQKEKTKIDRINAANRKLLHECQILHSRLKECSANFLADQDHELKIESPADAVDILTTSENRIGLLLAEAQLLAQEIATPVASSSNESDSVMATYDELRKTLTDVLIDNAILRKQTNSIILRALDATDTSADCTQMSNTNAPSINTVISKFFKI